MCLVTSTAYYGISIHALREEGDGLLSFSINLLFISIHALREEGDREPTHYHLLRNISIHALREEGDIKLLSGLRNSDKFLSTPSARRATGCAGQCVVMRQFLSTPSARRATATAEKPRPCQQISIHALREEGDTPKK